MGKKIAEVKAIDKRSLIGLQSAELSAVIFEGIAARTRDGKRASLAIVDEDGRIVESGPEVAKEAWGVMLACYRKFLEGNGHIRVHSRPPGPPH
jgi:ribulose-5-phosphate 4-epimerase/fuculose-1-phosphate aldolase